MKPCEGVPGWLTALILMFAGLTSSMTSAQVETQDDAARVDALKQKLGSIMLEKVNFNQADIADVLQFLTQKSRELDPAKQGINFVLRTGDATTDAASAPRRTFSATLDRISVGDFLNELVAQTHMEYSVEPFAVYVRPISKETDTMAVRTFLVPNGFFATASPDDLHSAVMTQQFLAGKGIRFPTGASATFIPESNKLVVRDTPQQLDALARLMEP